MDTIFKIKHNMLALGFDLNRLTTALLYTKKTKMSFEEKCNYINKLKFTYGELRFAPNALVKKHLGIEMSEILVIGNSSMMLLSERGINPFSLFSESIFHISHIKCGSVWDFGFALCQLDGAFADELSNEQVMDITSANENIGLGPRCLFAA